MDWTERNGRRGGETKTTTEDTEAPETERFIQARRFVRAVRPGREGTGRSRELTRWNI
jgi:hypothetical protein